MFHRLKENMLRNKHRISHHKSINYSYKCKQNITDEVKLIIK